MEEKVTITGASGFVGAWIQQHFQKMNIPYTAFQRDLLNPEDVESFFEKHPTDTVVHLAGAFAGDMETLLRKNVLVTQNLLAIGKRWGLKKIIYTSTGAVYGEPIGDESFETDESRPNTLYGLAKKFAEDTIQYYNSTEGINYVILRFPNVYGEGNKKGVLFNFLMAIQHKQKIYITGNGMQSRNFLHVADACIAIEKALFYHDSDKFNISNPTKLTINDLVEKLAKHYQFGIEYIPQDNFLKDLLLNTDKAKQLLGFTSAITSIDHFVSSKPFE